MADLVTTITESVVVNGALRGSTNTVTTTGIIDTFERVITCPHSATTTIATFETNVYDSAGAIDKENVRYIRATNLDATYDIELGVGGAASNYTILLPAGTSHIINRADDVFVAGNTVLYWDGTAYANGIYFVHLQGNNELQTQKIILLK